jgi:Co/Zn/Cd efflux system component
LIWAITAYLVIEAVDRLYHQEKIDINSAVMLPVSCVGLGLNILIACILFYSGKSEETSFEEIKE